jgi:thioredoxin-like negative regulator of GroEL
MPEIVKEIEASDWSTTLKNQTKPLMIMFYNPLCPHCQSMDSPFSTHANTFKEKITFMKFNIQQNQQIPYFYGVHSVPTFIFFCHGKPITILTGEIHHSILKHTIEDGLLHGRQCADQRTEINYEFAGYI